MLDWISDLLNSWGYLGIVLLMCLENVFPPIPSELIMPASGFAAARGELNILGVILAGTLGSVLGTTPLYILGRLVSEDRLAGWADRYGKWLTLSGKDIRAADDWFDAHGHKAVLFGRLVPGIRSLLSIPAGLSEMPFWKYLLYTSIGTAIWASALAVAGYALGENYEQIEHLIGPIGYVVLAGLVIWALLAIARRRRQGQAQAE